MLEAAVPGVAVTGLDADAEILGLARGKAAASRSKVEFVQAFSNAMPFDDESFDLIVSTLFFHHLNGEVKRATLGECVRVLRPGGRLVVGDWGRPSDPLMAALFVQVRALDGFGVTADNAHGRLPLLFEQAGLEAGGPRTSSARPGNDRALHRNALVAEVGAAPAATTFIRTRTTLPAPSVAVCSRSRSVDVSARRGPRSMARPSPWMTRQADA